MTPVDCARVDRVATTRQRALNRRMKLEGGRPAKELLVERDELFRTNARLGCVLRRGGGRWLTRVPARIGVPALLHLVVDLLEAIRQGLVDRLHLLLRQHSLADEPRAEDLARRRMLA